MLILVESHVMFVEVKAGRDIVRPLQAVFMAAANKRKEISFVVRSLSDFKVCYEKFCKDQNIILDTASDGASMKGCVSKKGGSHV